MRYNKLLHSQKNTHFQSNNQCMWILNLLISRRFLNAIGLKFQVICDVIGNFHLSQLLLRFGHLSFNRCIEKLAVTYITLNSG